MDITHLEYYKNAESLVTGVLKDIPEARNDNVRLVLGVWEKQGLLVPPQHQVVAHLHSPDSITRIKRFIQERGFYLPIPKKIIPINLLTDIYWDSFKKKKDINEDDNNEMPF